MSQALPLPTRFTDAEKINLFQVLIDLHDHALDRATNPSPAGAPAELALAAAVVARWSRWQPMTIHAALRAVATVAEVAAATGLDTAEVVRGWTRWIDVRTRVVIAGRPSVNTRYEVRTRAQIRAEVRP